MFEDAEIKPSISHKDRTGVRNRLIGFQLQWAAGTVPGSGSCIGALKPAIARQTMDIGHETLDTVCRIWAVRTRMLLSPAIPCLLSDIRCAKTIFGSASANTDAILLNQGCEGMICLAVVNLHEFQASRCPPAPTPRRLADAFQSHNPAPPEWLL